MICWCDVETTGLEPENGSLLEVALLVTDDDLRPLDDGLSMLVQPLHSTMQKMDDYVRDMHTKNGIITELEGITVLRRYEVAEHMIRYLAGHTAQMDGKHSKPPMAGSSIHFDRAWLKVHMPELEAKFSYRSIDVSTFYECAKRWTPDVALASQVEGPHRAMPDVLNSLEMLRQYKRRLFR